MSVVVQDLTEIIDQAQRGDTAAFLWIVRQYQSLVSGVLFSVTGDFHSSEDLAQETFLIAWKQIGDLRDEKNIAAWLCTIARNLAHRSVRNKSVNTVQNSVENETISPEPGPEAELLRREQSELVWSAIEEIPDAYRETLVLYYRSGQSVAEIAEATNSTQEAVRQRLVRARKSLKSKLETMIGDILTETAPGDVFTYAVMLAVTGTVVSTAQTVAAGTTTAGTAAAGTIATGTTTGKAMGLGTLWTLLGPLFYFVWMFAIVFISQWTLAQNTPTLRARRYRIHSFFFASQWFIPYIVLLAVIMTAVLLSLAGQARMMSSGGLAFSCQFLPAAGISYLFLYIYQQRFKAILRDDLGLSEKHVKSPRFEQVQRRLHLSVITNVLLLETAMMVALVLPVSRGAGTWWSAVITLALGGLFGVVLYSYYLFGRHLLLLCRSQASMVDYPPLVDEPFEVVLGLKIKAPGSIDHRKEAGRLYWLSKSLIWFGFGGVFVLLLSQLHWERNPLLIGLCVFGFVTSFCVSAFFRKRAKEKKTFHLIAAVEGLCNFSLAYALLTIECGSLSIQEICGYVRVVEPGSLVQLPLFLFMVVSLACSVICSVLWLRLHFLKDGASPTARNQCLKSAIARYHPMDVETDESVSIQEIPKKWIRSFIVYGMIVLFIFAFTSIFRDRIFGQTIRRMHYIHFGNYTALIGLEPNNPVFYFQRGCREGNPTKAMEDFDAAIRLSPRYVEAYLRRAEIGNAWARQRGVSEEKKADILQRSLADCDEAIRLEPEKDRSWVVRSQTHVTLGDHRTALTDATKAIEVQPISNNYFNRATIHNDSGDLPNALADCTEAIRLQEENNQRYGAYDQKMLKRLNEHTKPFYWFRARIYEKLNEHDKAKADLEKSW